MRRGELYRVERPGQGDPRQHRVYLVVSRQTLLDSRHSTVVCVPVFSAYGGLISEVLIGPEYGLKQTSSLHCDNTTSVLRDKLKHYVGALDTATMRRVDRALAEALGIEAG